MDLGSLAEKAQGVYELCVGNHLLKGKQLPARLTPNLYRQDADPASPAAAHPKANQRGRLAADGSAGRGPEKAALLKQAHAPQNDSRSAPACRPGKPGREKAQIALTLFHST